MYMKHWLQPIATGLSSVFNNFEIKATGNKKDMKLAQLQLQVQSFVVWLGWVASLFPVLTTGPVNTNARQQHWA